MLSGCYRQGAAESRVWEKGLCSSSLHGKWAQEWNEEGRKAHVMSASCLRQHCSGWLRLNATGTFWQHLGCFSELSTWGKKGRTICSNQSLWLRLPMGCSIPYRFLMGVGAAEQAHMPDIGWLLAMSIRWEWIEPLNNSRRLWLHSEAAVGPEYPYKLPALTGQIGQKLFIRKWSHLKRTYFPWLLISVFPCLV